jgi:hypothetical protein
MYLKTDTRTAKVERRRYSRKQIQGYCQVNHLKDRYSIVDISPGGLRITCPKKIEGGRLVELNVSLKNGYQFEANAYVVWIMEYLSKNQKYYEIGLAFEDLSMWDSHQLKILVGVD